MYNGFEVIITMQIIIILILLCAVSALVVYGIGTLLDRSKQNNENLKKITKELEEMKKKNPPE